MPNRPASYALALAIFLADQLSKYWVTGPLALERVQQIVILPIFNFTYVRNYGVSGGLFHASTGTMRWLLVAATAAIAVAVAVWIAREKQPGERIALALVLGGALGNIADRARLGYVTDFADLHFGAWRPFLVFNVGDAAISIGVAILLIRAFVQWRTAKPETPTHA